MSPMLVKAAIAGLAKGVAAIVGIALTAILARVLGADEAGLFFLGLVSANGPFGPSFDWAWMIWFCALWVRSISRLLANLN